MKKIIFTDLDGTLLDKTYSFKKAIPALKLLEKKKNPLIICTSKTRAEIEYYRKKLGNKDPFISENGGAIFIPKNYFNFKFKCDKKDNKYFIIKLGIDYKKLINILKKIKKEKYSVVGFSDMSIKEVAKDTGLSLNQAKLAKKRGFDEAFKILDKKDEKEILKLIKKNKFNYTVGGRYYHLMEKSDKGKAVKILSNLLRKKFGKIETVGIGDSRNDFEMLDKTDISYLVQRPNGSYASEKYIKAEGIGPVGWGKAVKEVLK